MAKGKSGGGKNTGGGGGKKTGGDQNNASKQEFKKAEEELLKKGKPGQPGGGGGGGGNKPKPKPKPPVEPEIPPMPTTPPPEGYIWEWEGDHWQLVKVGESEQERRDREEREEEEKDKAKREKEAAEAAAEERKRLEADLRDFLTTYFFEPAEVEVLFGEVMRSLKEGMTGTEIVMAVRKTDIYKARFPEQDESLKRGKGYMSEAAILRNREEVKRIARERGLFVETDPKKNPNYMKTVGLLTLNDVSISEFEHRLDVYEELQQWGPTVFAEFERRTGRRLSEEEQFAFADGEFDTEEIDREYQNAVIAARPAMLGLGVRPDEEVQMLRRYGIDIEQSFEGYRKLAQDLPRAQKLSMIDEAIGKGAAAGELPSTGSELFNDTPFALLFRAIQLGDEGAISYLQNQMANEIARFQVGGGPVFQGTQALGLLSGEERRTL